MESESRFDFLRTIEVAEPVVQFRAPRASVKKRKQDESTKGKEDEDVEDKFDKGTFFVAGAAADDTSNSQARNKVGEKDKGGDDDDDDSDFD